MRYRRSALVSCVCFLTAAFGISGFMRDLDGRENTQRHISEIPLPFGDRPKPQEIRDWINKLPHEVRKEAIASFYQQYGKPYLDRTRKQPTYKPPGVKDEDTREFVFKRAPERNLKLFVDYPSDWKASDKRIQG